MKNVAIAGATGAVGTEFLKLLELRKFPINNLKLLASERSVGKKLDFCGEQITVEELTTKSFQATSYNTNTSLSKLYYETFMIYL